MNVTIADTPMSDLTCSYILMAATWVFCFVIVGCYHEEQPATPPDELPYAEKYYMAFQQFPLEELDEERIKSLNEMYVKEETDKGTVIMCYNSPTEAFHYWCDHDISFASLDSVAQLYSLLYDCKALCVDYKAECIKAREHQTDIPTKPTKVLEGPFATFKSYKTNRKPYAIIPEKSNHFRKCGTISVWNTQTQKHAPVQWSATSASDTGRIWQKEPIEVERSADILTYNEWVSRKDKNV